ncbi:hypothetical protein, partial [Vibrio aestuarianus]
SPLNAALEFLRSVEQMDRKKLKAILKADHKKYLSNLAKDQRDTSNIEKRFINLNRKLVSLLRKEHGSLNSIKLIPNLARITFGLHEDIGRLSLPHYDFRCEKDILNLYIISHLSIQRDTQYHGECEYYGETLLNLYLDVLITLTCLKTPRHIENKPAYLINPKTEQNMELDIDFEEFRFAFEFQGETHYRNESEQVKDRLKLSICADNKVVLIPVNVSQLNGEELMLLILNSLKNALGLGVLTSKESPLKQDFKHFRGYKKVCQRVYLASCLFDDSLTWINRYADRFKETQSRRNPISSTTPAPRLINDYDDLSITEIYIQSWSTKKF